MTKKEENKLEENQIKENENTENTENSQEPLESDETISISDLMQDNLDKASKDATDFKDKYYRALAEMENTRKRLQQEKQEMISYAVDNMLNEFLAPLDNLEKALGFTDNLSDEMQNWAQGFKMIGAQFTQVLDNHGVTPYNSVGEKFDPHFHEAVETEVSDAHEDGTILVEVQKGYRHGDRILRVAKVKVSKKVPKNGSEESKN